ncbi:hypothetical protein T492DRAFT_1055006 [Pavlovales sp. CCMP2436]|nr:hypothetical protein T492DRAFT_1055006 [Pavlovales sp. CCMP2436]
MAGAGRTRRLVHAAHRSPRLPSMAVGSGERLPAAAVPARRWSRRSAPLRPPWPRQRCRSHSGRAPRCSPLLQVVRLPSRARSRTARSK